MTDGVEQAVASLKAIRAASSLSRTTLVPTICAITPPRSMSPASTTGTPAAPILPPLPLADLAGGSLAATATSAFGVFYSSIWQMAASMSILRLMWVSVTALALIVGGIRAACAALMATTHRDVCAISRRAWSCPWPGYRCRSRI